MFFPTILIFLLPALINGMIIRTTQFACEANSTICYGNTCSVSLVRKRLTLLNFYCCFREPQSSLWVHVKVYRKQGKTFQPWLVDFSEDICEVISKTARSQTFRKLLPSIRKYSDFSATCPLIGNATVSGYPVDYSYIPAIIPEGEYFVKAVVKNNVENVTIVVIKSNFLVQHPRKWMKP